MASALWMSTEARKPESNPLQILKDGYNLGSISSFDNNLNKINTQALNVYLLGTLPKDATTEHVPQSREKPKQKRASREGEKRRDV